MKQPFQVNESTILAQNMVITLLYDNANKLNLQLSRPMLGEGYLAGNHSYSLGKSFKSLRYNPS